jgi:hypothetical protein
MQQNMSGEFDGNWYYDPIHAFEYSLEKIRVLFGYVPCAMIKSFWLINNY